MILTAEDTQQSAYDSMASVSNDQSRVLPSSDAGMELDQFENILLEIRNQPPWRLAADKEADYEDGNQIDQETMVELEDRGQAPIIVNLMKATLSVVRGMEAKTRSNWRVRPEGDEEANNDLADALSMRLHKAEIESRADRACSDAYGAQIGPGLGWVEVSRESDPFKPYYRVQSIHRREMFWDWRAKSPDLSDARYMLRRQWMDKDVMKAAFPAKASLIDTLFGRTSLLDVANMGDTGLMRDIELARGTTIEQYEWLNTARNRVSAYELWYKQMAQGHVMRLPSGRVVELNLDNQQHVQAVLAGVVTPRPANFMRTRLSWWIGPYKLFDGPSPYKHNHYPYVPFFGFREDRTGIPFALSRAMMSPQDEINARKRKQIWLLSSKRVLADGDAVADHNKAAAEVSRPDGYIILNENRKPTSKFVVEDGSELSAPQASALQSAKDELQQAAGVFQAMLGQNSNASSGIAINGLVEQGSTGLADLNDNYRFSRRMVGELLFELCKEEIGNQTTKVVVEEDGQDSQVVILNQPGIDPATGQPTILNDVQKVHASVVLDDVPSTPTYRMQQLQQLTEMTKALPPNIQGMIIDFVIESTDLPKRQQMADRIRKGLGIQQDGQQPDPQVQALEQQLQQLQQLMQQGKQAYDEQVQGLQQQLQTAQQQLQSTTLSLNNKGQDNNLRQQELAAKAKAEESRASEAMATLQLKRDELAAEQRNKERDLRARIVEVQSNERTAKAAAVQPEPVEPAEPAISVDEIAAKVTDSLKPVIDGLAAELKTVKDTAKHDADPAQPMVLNITVDAKGGPNSMTVTRDKAGKIVGAQMVEE